MNIPEINRMNEYPFRFCHQGISLWFIRFGPLRIRQQKYLRHYHHVCCNKNTTRVADQSHQISGRRTINECYMMTRISYEGSIIFIIYLPLEIRHKSVTYKLYKLKCNLLGEKIGLYMLVLLASPRWRWCLGEYILVPYRISCCMRCMKPTNIRPDTRAT